MVQISSYNLEFTYTELRGRQASAVFLNTREKRRLKVTT